MPTESTQSPFRAAAAFRTTRWSMVLAAGSGDSERAAAAMETLCGRYWYPLYAYVRRRGHSHADASDLTQSFFARILENDSLSGVAPGNARFRSFLLAALKNFLINEWNAAQRLKRGGGKQIISLNDSSADELYLKEPSDHESPDRLFEKRWALSVLDHALERLRTEFVTSERPGLFDVLKPALTGDKLEKPYAEIASAFGLSEGALKVAIHRTRKRFAQLLREEVAATVQNSADMEDELRHLIEALGN